MTEQQSLQKRRKRPSKTVTPETKPQKKSKKSKREEKKKDKKSRKSGPRLPSSLLKELELQNPTTPHSDGEEEEEDGTEVGGGDFYEYEEGLAEEESKKNKRFDPVENFEYELPKEFEDEDVPSDEDEDIPSDGSEDDGEEEEDKHLKMLEGITGIPGEAFDGKEKKEVILPDLQGDVGDRKLSISDLLDPLHGKPGYSMLRKRLDKLEKKPMTVQAPLPKIERERLERKAAYEHSKKDIRKWEPLVKRNREAPTLYFEEDVNLGFSTVGAIASEFEPRTEFEKKMALLVRDPEVTEAHAKDGARLLELNTVTVEDVIERQNRLAKMRSLLFRHEMKAKRIKKIKSKTYHRISKKDKLKAASVGLETDPEALKESAMKQELKRAEERMTLKHKNSSKWAKRILKRGLEAQDEGTRAAISEQLNQHARLTRKMNSIRDSSSSDESSDDDLDELSPEADGDHVSKLLNRAKEKTAKVLKEENEMPKSGVFALPFMERGLKKREEEANEEARRAFEEYDSSLGQLKDEGDSNPDKASGRKVFGPVKKESQNSRKRIESENIRSSDSEDEIEATEHDDGHEVRNGIEEVQIGSALLHDVEDMGQESVFKKFDDIVKNPGPKTTYDVAIFASGSFKKMKSRSALDASATESAAAENPVLPSEDIKVMGHDDDSNSDEEMVDGILSLGEKPDYELPSQADLIQQAFAGDDVEAEFEKDKMEMLNEENPEPEKPVLIPGWGQWTHVQQKRGLPSWMVNEHERAKKKREEALKKRKDVNLKHTIISEKIDKKAEKLHAKTLPYPFTSKEVYEQSIRMPMGPDFNPAVSVGALNRPAVVKKAGIIIKPIQYEEVDPHAKTEEPQRIGGKKKNLPKTKNPKSSGGKTSNKTTSKKA